MDIRYQLVFFFSAVGGFNGLLLSLYFAYTAKKMAFSNYLLSLLLLTLSVRIIKSVFFYFNPDLAGAFIQIGLSACVLIGPYLYLYLDSIVNASERKKNKWVTHIIPFLVVVIVLGILYPYWTFEELWSRYLVRVIYLQWLVYIILAGVVLKNTIKNLFRNRAELKDIDIWLLSIYIGTVIIWFAYFTSSYTSYIVGSLSFSFVFYLLVLLWLFKRNKKSLFFEKKVKYENTKINDLKVKTIEDGISIVKDKKLYKKSDLKLSDVAELLNVLPHQLSQYLNNNLDKSFSLFLNEYRIEEAKRMLLSEINYTIEAIGYDCGFNSKSTFFTTFKILNVL